MNPLGIHPLHMNPLHMNGLASSAVPTTPDRRIGPIPPPPDEPHSGEQTVAVYIIDTGLGRQSTQAAVNYESQVLPVYGTIAGTHADAPDRWAPWGTPPPQFFVDPVAGHGTFIAGIYGQLLHADGRHPVITVFQDMNERGMIDEWDAYARIGAILAAHGDLPGVINLSFGGTLADFSIGGLNALKLAVDAASERFVVVASAGNVSMEKEHYPAAFGSAIGVGALDANGVAWFSNFGEWVECWAPGVDIISPFLQLIPKWKSPLFTHQGITMQGVILGTDFQGFNDPNLGHDYRSKWVAWSGTSFAAPIVGARAAEHLAGGDGLDAAKAKVLSEFPLNQL
jgi:subtilisin family serine protease